MSIPTSVLLKGIAGVASVATPVTFGVIHRDKISSFFTGENNTDPSQNNTESIKDKLGLPGGCDVSEDMNFPKDCQNLDANSLKAINFENKESGNLTVTDNATAKLNITKESDTTKFPKGLKFTLSTESEIEIENNDNDPRKITFKKDKNQVFKIKEVETKMFLEKVWSAEELAEKIGFESCSTSGDTKECSFKENEKINILDNSNTWTDAKITKDTKIKYEEQNDFEYGFKFFFENEITPTEGSKNPDSSITNLQGKSNASYEVKIHNDKWFLSKKTTTSPAN